MMISSPSALISVSDGLKMSVAGDELIDSGVGESAATSVL